MASKNKKDKKKIDDWKDGDNELKLSQLNGSSDDDGASDDEGFLAPPRKGKGLSAIEALAELESGEESQSDKSPESAAEEEPTLSKKAHQKGNEGQKRVTNEANGALSRKEHKGKGKKGKKVNKEEEDINALLADLDKPLEKKGKKKDKTLPLISTSETPEGAGIKTTDNAPEFITEKNKDVANEEAKSLNKNTDATVEEQEFLKKKDKRKKKKKGSAEKEGPEEYEVITKIGDIESNEPETVASTALQRENEGETCEMNEKEMTAEEIKKLKEKEKRKKREKKLKEAKEAEKKESKKKKHVDLIKQLLRERQQAEEELLRKQREEEEHLEALRKAKEEEERLAKEKREREKQRKKEREEQLKAEGRYLTPAQRAKVRKQQALLSRSDIILPPALRSDGEAVPRKKPVYGKKKYKKSVEVNEAKKSSAEPLVPSPDVSVPFEQGEEEVVESWDITEGAEESEELAEDWEEEHDAELAIKKSEKQGKGDIVPEKPQVAMKVIEDVKTDGIHKEQVECIAESSSSEESSESSSTEESEEEEPSDDERAKATKEEIKEKVRIRLRKRRELAESKRSLDNLRSPVICVLGHVDTGKTKMLDTIRRTNVQDGEAGGITQQIGATQVPGTAIKERTKMVRDFDEETMKIPGLLIIDTPGHESFANLRSRGSSLCDYAILIVDLMHGLEPQTIESLKLLMKRETPFVIALNKIDRLYDYESNPRKDVFQHLKSQSNSAQLQFKELKDKVIVQFAEQGLNVALAIENPDPLEYISMIPTSAFLGDGIGNLMAHIVNECQNRLANKLAFCEELECSVMEVKSLPGLGTTIDVVLVNGTLRVGDIIVLTGTDGAIMSQIRELLMPQPLRELRVKSTYEHFQSIKGAQGVKILAKGMEKALAGLPLYVATKEDELDVLKEDCELQLSRALMAIKKKAEGVYVQASTLGSLEALLDFLKTQKIPYSNVNIGPVHKKDVQKAAVMLERKEEYACILAFDVRVDREAELFAASEGVRIFQADIIYHLEENFLKYREELRLKRRKENEHLAIFPCKLRVLPQHVFNARNPIVVGVSVEAGQLKRGTPLCVPSRDCIFIGTVSSIERNHEQLDLAKAGDEVCIKIENTTGEAPKLYGRHFTYEDPLVSKISRESIDVCKAHFREDLTKADWQLVVQLKKLLDIL